MNNFYFMCFKYKKCDSGGDGIDKNHMDKCHQIYDGHIYNISTGKACVFKCFGPRFIETSPLTSVK